MFVGVEVPLSVSVLEEFEILRFTAAGGSFLCWGDSRLVGLADAGGDSGVVILQDPESVDNRGS